VSVTCATAAPSIEAAHRDEFIGIVEAHVAAANAGGRTVTQAEASLILVRATQSLQRRLAQREES
jgi:hypothetical protein